jgi:GDP-L-fucose synthase
VTKIFVAGHNGMVGSAICRQLREMKANVFTATRDELDLTNQEKVNKFFKKHHFSKVYLAAAKVGGIHANNVYPADFIYENLVIQTNVINAAFRSNVDRLLFLGSSCIYPKLSTQPIKESELLKGSLEPTNEPYAIAKIAGIKMCESYNRQFNTDFRSIMPTNLYGPGDNYHSENSHVVPALIKKFHQAKISGAEDVLLWGSGRVRREFLHVDDMANASIHVMSLTKEIYEAATDPVLSHLNVGAGEDCTIFELAELISEIIGFNGKVLWDADKPDGAPRKLMDSSKLNKLGWTSSIFLKTGLENTYTQFLADQG